MRLFSRRESAVANPNPEVLRQRLDALAGVDLRLPNYHEFSVLARGGSSVVFLARERRIDRPVAIKVLPPDKELHAAKQFEREKEIAVSLGRHPYIVQVFDAGSASDGSPFLVMEYFERGSLADRLRSEGPLSFSETLSIIEKIGSALQAAHDAGILHRDVKPSNILFSEYGPSLSDFGISRSVSRGEWTQSLAHFTPWHSAPEILEGDHPATTSDLYSLASTMFTALDGRPPFVVAGDDRSLAYQLRVLRDPLPTLLRRDLPPELHEVLVKAMAKLPADRFDSVTDFLVALRALPMGSSAGDVVTQTSNQLQVVADQSGAPQTSASQSSASKATASQLGAEQPRADRPSLGQASSDQASRSPTNAGLTDLSSTSAPGDLARASISTIGNPGDAGIGGFEQDDEDDAMFRPPPSQSTRPVQAENGAATNFLSAQTISSPEFAPATGRDAVEIDTRPEESGYAWRVAPPVESNFLAPAQSPPTPIRSSAPFSEPKRNPAVRSAQPIERMSPAEEEATVYGQRRVVAPPQTVPTKKQLPLAWIALLVTAVLGGLIIAFYPGKKPAKPIAVPVSVTSVAQTEVGSTVAPTSAPNAPQVDPIPRVSPSSPQQVTVAEKLEDSGELALAEIRWTDGTPPLVAAYVAASKQGGEPKAVPIGDAASKRAVIVGIDPKAAYCFWVVAFDTKVKPIVQYRSEQQCVRGGVPYNFN
jgi:serine/threonine protein kinase